MKARNVAIPSAVPLLFLAIGGCATTQVRVPVERPAEIELGDIRRIAVSEFEGEGGLDITEDLTQELSASGRFEVIDRRHVERLMRENRLAADGLIDQETAIKLGRLLGVAALVYGRVATYDYREDREREPAKTLLGERYINHTRYGRATIEIAFNVIDLETGRILAAKKITRSYGHQTSARNSDPPPIDRTALLAGTRRAVVQRFMRAIAPYEEMVPVSLLTDGDVPELERGVALVRIKEWDEALEVFKQAAEKHPENPKVLYDLGIAYKYTYQFDEAEEYLKAAYLIEHDELFEREINHLRQMRADAASRADEEAVLVDLPASGGDGGIPGAEASGSEEDPLDVTRVQETLNALGYDCGAVDGLMGPNTRGCIRAFQEAQGLELTGELDQATTAALRELM